jgi:Ran GTPase-activating protein (RanGAP) involved in mRNA processing and transport
VLPSLPHLTHLNLSCNVGGGCLATFCRSALTTVSPLTSLDLAANHLNLDDVVELTAAFPRLPHLRHLNLSCTDLGTAGFEVIAPLLPQLSSLESLSLASNRSHQQGVIALARELPQLARLTQLDLSGNFLFQPGFEALAAAFPFLTALKKLELGFCVAGEEGFFAVAPHLPQLTALEHLDLRCNPCGTPGLQALAAVLPRMTRLMFLNVSVLNPLLQQACDFLSAFRSYDSPLRVLNISGNLVDEPAAAHLAAMLMSPNGRLTKIDLLQCGLSNAGVDHLARALRVNTTLQSLGLGFNALDGHGIATLAAALCVNTALTSLDLTGNQIAAESPGPAGLASLIQSSTSLVHLHLPEMVFNDRSVPLLLAALTYNATLLTLQLPNTGVDFDTQIATAELTQRNRINSVLRQRQLFPMLLFEFLFLKP